MSDTADRNYWEVPESLVTGAWAEKRRLAAALRELAALCVTTDAPEEPLKELSALVGTAIEKLRAHPGGTFRDGYADCRTLDEVAVFTDRATLTGLSNPFAPPMEHSMEGDVAIGNVTFGPPYEGAPGFVHGGMVAAAFDQVFGYLQVCRGATSLTGSLTVHYRRPTPLLTPLRYEATFDKANGRRHHVKGRLLAGGDVVAEAEGVFVAIDVSHFERLVDDVGKRFGGG